MEPVAPDDAGEPADASRGLADEWFEPYGPAARLLVFLEELALATALVRARRLAEVRLASVAADHLVDVLLRAHAEQRFASSEEGGWAAPPQRRFSTRERQRIYGDFGRKVTLATESLTDGPSWRQFGALLDEEDAAVLVLIHRERNRVHHEDRHNANLLMPLTHVLLDIVASAYITSVPLGWGEPFTRPQRERLQELMGDSAPPPSGPLDLRDVAERAVAKITAGLEVDFEWLRGLCILDLKSRVSQVTVELLELRADGAPDDRIEWAIRWHQTWTAFGADGDAQELLDERESTAEQARDATGEQRLELEERSSRANEGYVARWQELQRTFKPSASLASIGSIERLAPRLQQARKLRSLLERYEQLHDEMAALEAACRRRDGRGTPSSRTRWIVPEGSDGATSDMAPRLSSPRARTRAGRHRMVRLASRAPCVAGDSS